MLELTNHNLLNGVLTMVVRVRGPRQKALCLKGHTIVHKIRGYGRNRAIWIQTLNLVRLLDHADGKHFPLT